MTISDWTILYLSIGVAFGVSVRGESRFRNVATLASVTATSLLWPLLLTKRSIIGVKTLLVARRSSNSRKHELRETLARILEAERPGVSIVRARESVDWYLELGEAVSEMDAVLKDDKAVTPAISLVSGRAQSRTSAIVLERMTLRKTAKHLTSARENLVDQILNNELLKSSELERRKALLSEVSEIIGDKAAMTRCIDKPVPGDPISLLGPIESSEARAVSLKR